MHKPIHISYHFWTSFFSIHSQWNKDIIAQVAKFMGPTWGPPGSCRPQMGPMLARWTLLSGRPWYSWQTINQYYGCWCLGSLCHSAISIHWWCRMCIFLIVSSLRVNFNSLTQFSVREWYKLQMCFYGYGCLKIQHLKGWYSFLNQVSVSCYGSRHINWWLASWWSVSWQCKEPGL